MKRETLDTITNAITVFFTFIATTFIYIFFSLGNIISDIYHCIFKLCAKKATVPPDQIWVGYSRNRKHEAFYTGEEIVPAMYIKVTKFLRYASYHSGMMLLGEGAIDISFRIEITDPSLAATIADSTDELMDEFNSAYRKGMIMALKNPNLFRMARYRRKKLLNSFTEEFLLEKADFFGLTVTDIEYKLILRK